MGRTNNTRLHNQLAAEHSRLHIVGSWPEIPQKEALVLAIGALIARLSRNDDPAYSFQCMICRSRNKILPLYARQG